MVKHLLILLCVFHFWTVILALPIAGSITNRGVSVKVMLRERNIMAEVILPDRNSSVNINMLDSNAAAEEEFSTEKRYSSFLKLKKKWELVNSFFSATSGDIETLTESSNQPPLDKGYYIVFQSSFKLKSHYNHR